MEPATPPVADADRLERLEALLREAVEGVPAARERLFDSVYSELRAMACRQLRDERPGHSWQPTELVHQVFLRLFTGRPLARTEARYFFGAVRRAMRQLLVEHARRRQAQKRPEHRTRVPLDEVLTTLEAEQQVSLLDLYARLDELEELHPRQHEVVELRYLVGLSWKEIAAQLDLAVPTVEKDWRAARAWLRSRLDRSGDGS